MTFPNETLPKGRKQKTTALYDRFVNQGAVMGDGFGLESVLWFANDKKDAYEEPTIKRSRSHNYVSKEVINVRENVGVMELANFSKHEFKGPDAKKFLDYVMAGKLPKPGRISLSPMLTRKGKLYGDLTVACLDDFEFMIFGSGAAQEMHRRWFESHIGKFNLEYKNRSDDFHGLAISGPKSREVLQKVVRDNVSNDKFKFRDAVNHLIDLARTGNKYLADKEPWKLHKENNIKEVEQIIYTSLETCALLSILSEPFIPNSAKKIRDILDINLVNWTRLKSSDKIIQPGHKIKKSYLIFRKIEDDEVEKQLKKLNSNVKS